MTDYGSDISCMNDIDPTCKIVTGARLVAEALYRRLITPRGRLLSDPQYGTDITQWLNDDAAPVDLAALAGAIEAECRKDERVFDVTATVTAPAKQTGAYTAAIVVTLQKNVSFTLVLAVASVTVTILQIPS